MNLELIKPELKFEEIYSQFIKEYIREDQQYYTILKDIVNTNSNDTKKIIQNQISWNSNQILPEGWFPVSIFWLKLGEKIVGESIVRHELNSMLESFAGHITYYISSHYRKQGLGKKLLEMTLLECKKLNIKNIIICCDENNVASKKVLESIGATYLDTIDNMDDWGEITLRYKIASSDL